VLNEIHASEALAAFSRKWVQASDAWYGVACRELGAFKLKTEERANKQHLKTLVPVLQKALSIDALPIPLDSVREASDLAIVLRKFQRDASAHRTKGGSLANVWVGHFRFDDAGSCSDHAQTRLKKSMPEVIFSKPATASVDWNGTSLAQVHASLTFTMALEKNRMLLNTKFESDSDSITKGYSKLLIDVRAISPALLLQMQNITTKSDGSGYKSGNGLCAPRGSSKVLNASLAEGIMCVLFVRESLNPDRDESAFGPLADSLNLDRVRSA